MLTNLPYPRRRARLVLWAFLLPLLSALAPTAAGQQDDCPKPRSFYSQGNFKVRRVRIESPLDFMHALSKNLDEVRPKLPLQPGGVFTLEKSDEGRALIEEALAALEEEDDPRSAVRVVLAGIDRCDENGSPPQLDVYYRVFTTNYNSYLSHTFETKNEELERPAAAAAEAAAETQTKGFLKVQPSVSYNRTRRLFAGARARLRMPGGLFDSAEVSAGGSSSGNEQAFELSGSRSPGRAALSEFEYRAGYRHSDLAAGANRLREGLMQAQFFGATKPLGAKGVVLRYGASLEGGNQQTDLAAAAAAAASEADSGYGGLKAYLGATLRTKSVAAAASYGLQLGARGATADLDFVKHVGDLSFNARWLLNREGGEFHRFVTLEAQLTGGAIKTMGRLPVAQRFFGGNAARDFIEGDTWRIRSEPFIRSIPENRLGPGQVGGTGFYSANLTLAVPVWGKPLVPAEVAQDPDFPGILEAGKETARKLLVFRHLSDTLPAFRGIIEGLRPADVDLKELAAALATLPWECPSDPPDDQPEIEEATCLVKDRVTILRSQLDVQNDESKANLLGSLGAIVKAGDADPDCVVNESCSTLKDLRVKLETSSGLLRPAGFAQVADTFDRVRGRLDALQPSLAASWSLVLTSPEKAAAERQATEDMAQFNAVLDTFLYELNWFSVSPVAVFDAARVWPDSNGTRYGVGGGVRFSLVNFNLTAGYAFNPDRKPGEGRGAMFFSMDVTDLFR